MRKISVLTLVLNERCNFSCFYCPQRRGKSELRLEDIRAFLESLRPRLAKAVWLGFYGGEPLLSWPLVEQTVAAARTEERTRFHFTLTTNGSLLKKEHILFFKKNRFALILSYDGRAQGLRDAASVTAVEAALANLRRSYPQGYLINSVFAPRTVPLLAASIEDMLEQGHRRLQYALDMSVPWGIKDLDALKEQLARLAGACLTHRRKTGKMPLENFKTDRKKGVFACFAGRDRLALLPDRTVWGCEMFYTLMGQDPRNPDYARYCFGKLGRFMSGSAQEFAGTAANYAELRQDYFFTEKRELCSLCADMARCATCPAVGALATGIPGVLPSWLCRIQRITRDSASRSGLRHRRKTVDFVLTGA